MTMKELAERCEAATGPSHELDLAIAEACYSHGFGGVNYDPALWVERYGGHSGSLDAAMTLVPEWAKLHFLQDTEYDNPVEKTWSANLRAREEKAAEPGFGSEWQCWCSTPALALCAAALKARASQEPTQ